MDGDFYGLPIKSIDNDLISLEYLAEGGPCKIAYANKAGWMAYLYGECLFIKRFETFSEKNYSGFGSSAECYCNDRFLELETSGPCDLLVPGQEVRHRETCELHSLDSVEPDIDGIREAVTSLD